VVEAVIAHCGRQLSAGEVELLVDIVRRFPKLSRTELAATVCELLDWQRANERLKTRECFDLLAKLEQRGLVELPALRPGRPPHSTTRVPRTSAGRRQPPLIENLAGVSPIEIEPVVGARAQALWRELVGRYHYLGYRTPFGARLRYFVRIGRPRAQIVGCLQYSSAAWRITVRDRWIGWNEPRRVEKLTEVIQQSRFLLLPWVKVPHLASHVLALSARSIAGDWYRHYRARPLLIETLVDIGRYRGTSYRAANWIDLGLSAGTGRTDRGGARCPKRVFVYPLHRRAREHLSGAPR
jgi:hypothetical protein